MTTTASESEGERVPMWVVQLIGRLTIENELLRSALSPPAPDPQVPASVGGGVGG